MISPVLITAPVKEAVSVAEVKLQIRSSSDLPGSEDALINRYIKASRVYYEERTSRTIHETEWELTLSGFIASAIELPRATPLVSITSVKYVESDGTPNTVNSSLYIADTWNIPGSVALAYGESWPSFTPYPVAPVRIRYKAGIATTSPAAEADDADKVPILLLAAHLYENREAVNIQDRGSINQISVAFGVEAFIALRTVRHQFNR